MRHPTGTVFERYTSKLSKMRIRIKIFVLGFLTISLLTTVSIEKYNGIMRLENEGESNAATAILFEHYSAVIQELQRERGLSYGPLNFQGQSADKIATQRQRTDTALGELIKADPHEKQLMGYLNENRALTLNSIKDFNTIFSNYTFYISKYLNKASFLTLSTSDPQTISLVNACKKILFAREYLGQIRAIIFRTYQDGKTSLEHTNKIYFLYLNYKNYINELVDPSNSNFSKKIQDYSQLPATQHIYTIISEILKGKLPEATPEEWFADCTQLIDHLQQLYELGIRDLTDALHASATKLHRESLFKMAAYSALALATLFLTIVILYRIYMPIKIMTQFINDTIKTGNFNDNINLRISNEFGTISDSIDTLINYSKKLLSEKDYIAYHDALTGVFNRHKFLDIFANELERSQRYGHTFAFIILDIDHFKAVNDTYGHQTGDLVLKELARVINDNLRANDTLARWGGEEFVLLIPETDKKGTLHLAEKIRSAIEANIFPAVGRVTISIGVTLYSQDDSLETMCARADNALYRSKEKGRNRVTII
jgi:diguanylate cyclase (GGDEF)-like protein